MHQPSSINRQSRTWQRPFTGSGPERRILLVASFIAVMLAIAAAAWAIIYFRGPEHKTVRLDISAPPPPLPVLKTGFLPLAPAKAEAVNAGIPTSTAPIEFARSFVLPTTTATNLVANQSAVDCLTAAIYYEAASESARGQRAVAQVVLNRVRHPAYPKSVCGVVYEGAERRTGCQFSFTCDGSLARTPSQAGWNRARGIALAALSGFVEPSVGTATHYHTVWVVPYWAWSLDKVTTLGAHIFYRWKGYWGRRSAFSGVYAGESADGEHGMLPPGIAADGLVMDIEAVRKMSGPRPLADDIGPLAADSGSAGALSAPPRADQENGTLRADENAGTLLHPDAKAK